MEAGSLELAITMPYCKMENTIMLNTMKYSRMILNTILKRKQKKKCQNKINKTT